MGLTRPEEGYVFINQIILKENKYIIYKILFLKNLQLNQFKNHKESRFIFDKAVNCFVGDNGSGKTNILDAIYHLSYGKSYFNPLSVQNIKHDEDFFLMIMINKIFLR